MRLTKLCKIFYFLRYCTSFVTILKQCRQSIKQERWKLFASWLLEIYASEISFQVRPDFLICFNTFFDRVLLKFWKFLFRLIISVTFIAVVYFSKGILASWFSFLFFFTKRFETVNSFLLLILLSTTIFHLLLYYPCTWKAPKCKIKPYLSLATVQP